MKKILVLSTLIIFIVGCTSNDVENTEEENNTQNDTDTTEEENDTEEREILIEEDTEEENHDNSNEEYFQQMLEEFISDSYTEQSVSNFRNAEDLLSSNMQDLLNNEQQAAEIDWEQIERSVEDFEIYSTNENDKYMYLLTLQIVDHDERNIGYTERYGEVVTTEEDNDKKIESMREIGFTETGLEIEQEDYEDYEGAN